LLQTFLIFLLPFLGVFSQNDIMRQESMEGYSLQLLNSLLAGIVCYFLYKKGWGFSFSFQPVLVKRRRMNVISLMILAVLSIEIAYFSFVKGHIDLYITSLIIIIAALSVLLTLLIAKEKKHD
jgi:hypothetical protein